MTAVDDTIAAVITPPGEGGIAAVRLAGPRSLEILGRCFRPSGESRPTPFLMRHGVLLDRHGNVLDEVMAVCMPSEKSYTGLDQAEIFCHGGRLIVRRILAELLTLGARAAEPGEFTRLAFMNGRIDLSRAEAVAEMISANTDQSLKASREHLLGAYSDHINRLRDRLVGVLAELEASIDMSEEEIDPAEYDQLNHDLAVVKEDIDELLGTYRGGRILREGFRVAIGGRPNAGKSSLFNRLLRQERALVNPEAGTTRDYLSEWVDLDGFAVNLVDTAGLRKGGGEVERMGQARAQELMAGADMMIWMLDISEPAWRDDLREDLAAVRAAHICVAANKIDLVDTSNIPQAIDGKYVVAISCKTGEGLELLRNTIVDRINVAMPDLTSGLVVTSARHQEKLAAAQGAIERTMKAIENRESPEITSFELRQGVAAVDEITGRIYTEDILGRIFSTFCVGK